MIYRELTADEWHLVETLHANNNAVCPAKDNATAFGAFTDGGGCVGLLCAQVALHTEPLWLASPHVSAARLHDALETTLKARGDGRPLQLFASTSSARVAQMAVKSGGFEILRDEILLRKVVK